MSFTKIISICFGFIADIKFYPPIQKFINQQYINIFKINLKDFYPFYYYKSLNELFTRGLKQKREFDKDKNIFISPVDGKLVQSGKVKNNRALQIKGVSYSVEQLLGESFNKNISDNLSYANLYLSPSNYHRYHAPCDMFVESITHFKGALYPVHLKSLTKRRNVFIANERVVLKAKDIFGNFIYFVAVGALNVGSMVFYIEPEIQSKHNLHKKTFNYKEPIFIKKGDEIGMFKMGSTIVLFAYDVEILKSDCKISFGDSLFRNIENLG